MVAEGIDVGSRARISIRSKSAFGGPLPTPCCLMRPTASEQGNIDHFLKLLCLHSSIPRALRIAALIT